MYSRRFPKGFVTAEHRAINVVKANVAERTDFKTTEAQKQALLERESVQICLRENTRSIMQYCCDYIHFEDKIQISYMSSFFHCEHIR